MQAILNNLGANRIELTIANGAAVTGSFYAAAGNVAADANVYGFRGLAVFTTSNWTPADLTVDASLDGSTWLTLRTDTGAIVRATGLPGAGGFFQILPASLWAAGAMPSIRLRSVNTASEANVNQGQAVAITAVLMR